MGIGGDDAAAGGLEAADVVFVVADEDDVFVFELMLFAPGFEAFIFAVFEFMEAFEFQFFTAFGDDGIDFGGHDGHTDVGFVEVADAPAVTAVAADGFDAVFGEIDGVIGEDAIEVEDDGVDGCGEFI